MVVGVCRDEDI